MKSVADSQKSKSAVIYAVVAVLLIAAAYGGYALYHPSEERNRSIASVPAAAPTSPAPPTEAEKKIEVPKKVEVKSAPPAAEVKTAEVKKVTEVKKVVEVAKTKESVPAAKAKEVPPAPAAQPQEKAPPVPAKEEVAVVKPTAPPVFAGPLTLKMNIIGQRKEAEGQYTEILVNEGSDLRSQDNFQIHLEASRPAYVYILMYDSQGKATQIFPDPKIDQPGFVEGGRKLVVPSRELWFWLDESTGTETIYVLASDKPMTDIRGLLGKMEGRDNAGQQRASREIKERIAVMQRGVGGIVKGNSVIYTLSDGKKIEKVTDVVTGTGSVVRAVSFLHR